MFSLVIPTYNEKDNIESLLEKIQSSLQGICHEIIVVDDDSPDRTWQLIQLLAKENTSLRLIRRTKSRGLSSAVFDGFKKARGEILAVMDADLSHDVSLLPEMVRLIESQHAECVVGSRRVTGGGVDHWPFYRKWFSDFATALAHILTGIQVKDPMSGYFCLGRNLFDQAEAHLRPKGYKILLEFLVKSSPRKIVELPYVFVNRRQGYSKLSMRVMTSYFFQLIDLFFYRVRSKLNVF